MSSTNATAPISDQKIVLICGPMMRSRNGVTSAVMSLLRVGVLLRELRGDIGHLAPCLFDGDAVGEAAVHHVAAHAAPRRSAGGRWVIGVHTSCWNGHLKPSGITPMIVAGMALAVTGLPIMSGSEAYRDFQMPPLINTTGGAFGASSASTNPRPNTGWTPIRSNAFAVI